MTAFDEVQGSFQPVALRSRDALQRAGWRVLDMLIAATLLVLLLPMLVLVAAAIRLDSRGGALFRQRRLGLDMEPFTVNKFRTMRKDCASKPHEEYVARLVSGAEGANGTDAASLYKLVHDERVTRLGGFLRKWSIDELPQLWNVLRGDMSLVGPRPAISYELDHYEPGWYERFSVKPGITGLWQVSGRSELSFRDMVRLDLEYASTWSLGLNVRILTKTAWVVVRRRGAV
jgi:lipopolysaccharide/colanic/teichoic acid biosynthesis glycosyltransferase